MKYCISFQLYENGEEPFSEIVKTYRENISEVFFAWQDIATGRSAVATRHGYTDWSAQSRCEAELRKIKDMGVKLDLLFNGNCYGEYAISEKLAKIPMTYVKMNYSRSSHLLFIIEKNTKGGFSILTVFGHPKHFEILSEELCRAVSVSRIAK